MKGKSTVTINGVTYDNTTGMPVRKPSVTIPVRQPSMDDVTTSRSRPTIPREDTTTAANSQDDEAVKSEPKPRHHRPATNVHTTTQRSHTLHRSGLQKPAPVHHHTSKPRTTVAKSPHVQKFAPHPQPLKKQSVTPPATKEPNNNEDAATPAKNAPQQAPATPTNKDIKNHVVQKQLDRAPTQHTPELPSPSPKRRLTSLVTAGFALILLGGYLTYLNMPGLSMRVATVQAGINASLPDYKPDGFRFDGPITYSQGEVRLSYAANGGPDSYTITQRSSDWDSQTVRDNYVIPRHGNDFRITSVQGLTVYSTDSAAVWVNRGVLHEVQFDGSPLASSQVERIAASM